MMIPRPGSPPLREVPVANLSLRRWRHVAERAAQPLMDRVPDYGRIDVRMRAAVSHRSMTGWVPFALISILAYGIWGVLGKVALDHVTWAQGSLLFGIGVVTVSAIGLVTNDQTWSARGFGLAAIAGVAGALGLGFFYLALSKGPASQVAAAIGAYPALTTILALLFLTERLTAVQAGGVVLAVGSVLLVGLGG